MFINNDELGFNGYIYILERDRDSDVIGKAPGRVIIIVVKKKRQKEKTVL